MNKNIKHRREKLRTALETAILVAVAAIIFALVLLGLYKINMIRLPEVLEGLIGNAETQAPGNSAGGNEQRIYASLSGKPAAQAGIALEYYIDTERLLNTLQSATPESSYYLEAEITRSNGGKTLSRTLKLSRDNDKYFAQIYDGSSPEPTTLKCDGAIIRYSDNAAGGKLRTRDYTAGGDFSLEYQLGLPSLADIAENEPEDLAITLLRNESENLYCIEYKYPGTDIREIIYISVRFNCIVSAQTYANDVLVYSLNTTRFNAGAAFGDSLFTIEESK